MTEAEWLQTTDPFPMAEHLGRKVGPRRRCLFACACWRLCWDQAGAETQAAVEEIEAHLDRGGDPAEAEQILDGEGVLGMEESERIWDPSGELDGPYNVDEARVAATLLAAHVLGDWQQLRTSLSEAARLEEVLAPEGEDGIAWARQREAQCRLLRELFGNPFRRPAVEPSWLTWNDGAVAKLARSIDAERAFERLAVLADALQDAGCADADLLGHCRGPGPHLRGCWALDLLLGRE